MKTSSGACLLIVAAFLLAFAYPALGDDGGWKMPNLNPFSQKTKTTTTAWTGKPPTSGWHMPKLWPSTTTAQTKPNQPSTMQKMGTGTKNFFSKTADALNPWDNAQPAAPPPKPSGSNSAFSQATAKKKDTQSTSLLPSWPWGAKAEDKKDNDVNAFLARPRPGY